MPEFFRIDEFAQTADGSITARDRVRFASFGFDIQSLVPGDPFTSDEQPTGARLMTPLNGTTRVA